MDIENTNSSFINLKVVGKCGVLPATFSLEEDFMAEIVEFNGKRYSIDVYGYYRTHSNKYKSTKLHRDVWEFYSGKKIPKGYEIHHIDRNKGNNEYHNLLCCSIKEHNEIHREEGRKRSSTKEHLEMFAQARKKAYDDLKNTTRICVGCGKEYIPTNTRQKYCTKQCYNHTIYEKEVYHIKYICEYCGTEFYGRKAHHRKYCSRKCSGKAQWVD